MNAWKTPETEAVYLDMAMSPRSDLVGLFHEWDEWAKANAGQREDVVRELAKVLREDYEAMYGEPSPIVLLPSRMAAIGLKRVDWPEVAEHVLQLAERYAKQESKALRKGCLLSNTKRPGRTYSYFYHRATLEYPGCGESEDDA